MNLFETLRARGYETVPESYYRYVDDWRSWYNGKVEKFHRYKISNGQGKVSCERYSMGMAKKLCEDWADLLLNEKVKVTLEGEAEQEFIDSVFTENDFWVRANEMQELKSALGTAAYVPRITNATVDGTTGNLIGGDADIKIDFVQGGQIIPLSWDNRRARECAFGVEYNNDKEKYVYVQIHKLASNGNYDIENLLYRNTDGSLQEVELNDVDAFSHIPAVIHTGSPKPQFVLDRLSIVNNIDTNLPLGISVYANAIDQLKGVDIAYDSYINEFVLGKKRIMVKPEAQKDMDGNPYFDANDTYFYVLPEDSQADSTIKEIDMSLRTADHNAGMQDMLNALSSRCGFGVNHYQYDRGSISTATQIISENSEMFRTLKKHEIVLESVIIELCRILLRMGNQIGKSLNEDVEISIDFDDSIIEDDSVNFERDARMVSMGIMNPWEFRMKWMNEDEETAKAALPIMNDLLSGDGIVTP